MTQAVRVALPSGGGAKAVWRSLWLVAAYWIAGRVSLLLADPQVLLSAVWLPSGIAMAATLRYGWAMLPAIYIADVLTGVSFGTPLQASIGIGVAAVVEAALGAHLLRRGGHFAREACGVRDVAGLIAYGAVAAPLAAGLIGTAACVAAGTLGAGDAGRAILLWWAGDAMGVLVVAPLVTFFVVRRLAHLPRRGDALVALAATAVAAAVFALADPRQPGAQALPYAVFPLAAWAAMTVSAPMVGLMNAAITTLAIVATALGRGPFAITGGRDDVLYVQGFVLVLTLMTLLMRGATNDRQQVEARARDVERRFHAAADASPNAVMVLRPAGGDRRGEPRDFVVDYANERARTLLPALRDASQTLVSRIAAAGPPGVMARYAAVSFAGEPADDESRWQTADGERWLHQTAVPIANGLLVSLADVTEQKRSREHIERLATRDALTMLPNRSTLHRHLEQALATARPGAIVGVLFIEVERVKAVNDAFGHQVGDEALAEVAARIAGCATRDLVARPGGSVFVIVVKDAGSARVLEAMAEQVRSAVAAPLPVRNRSFTLASSIGIALAPVDANDAVELMRFADLAMVEAKKAGPDQVRRFHADMAAGVTRRSEIEEALAGAAGRGELSLHYQPQWNTASETLVGAEVLLRWRHPRLGPVQPDQFIPIAEETGLIVPIGDWVLEEACRQLTAWRGQGLSVPRLSINLSTRQLDAGIAGRVLTILDKAGLGPDAIQLELTESWLMGDVEACIAALRSLHALGVQLSIDDFGVGYSSLSYLKRLPIDSVKIDKSFLHDMVEDESGRHLVAAFVSLARILKYRSVAEGVETEAQLGLLREMGCDEFQGWLRGRPVPAEDFVRSFVAS